MNHKILLAATLGVPALAPRAQAQLIAAPPALVKPHKATDEAQWRAIELKNVVPRLMAYWLDPAHTVMPAQYQDVKPTWTVGRTAAEIQAMFSLPEGVEAVVGMDQQNKLWVMGTEAGIREAKQKIEALDQPLQQVQVQVKCVQISAADVKTLGIEFPDPAKGAAKPGSGDASRIEVGLAGAGIEAQIAALVAQNRAKILLAPQVTAVFGATAKLKSTQTTPVVVGLENKDGFQIRQLTATDPKQDEYLLGIDTSFGLTVTPTLRADGTIALQMGPLRTVGITGFASGDNQMSDQTHHLTLRDLDGIPSQPILVKDAQTAALRGLTWNVLPGGSLGFLGDPKGQAQNVIVLVTARILRRAQGNVVAAWPR